MGSTDSKTKPCLQKQYRLVRKFMSNVYGGSQVTVIEHKQTTQLFVLRQFVQQIHPQKFIRQLQEHRSLGHRNLIQLRRFWMENDVNICSSLFKIYAVFDYHEITLEQWLSENKEKNINDRQIADFVKQMNAVFNFLQRNKVFWLISGPKSIAVSIQKEEALRDRSINLNTLHHRSASKLQQQIEKNGRRSLIVSGDYFRNGGDDFRVSFRKQSYSNLLPQSQRKVYKIFDPLQGISSNKAIHKLENYMQVPIHPNISNTTQHYLLSDSQVRQQNNLTIGLIALSMCQRCQFQELDIYKNGKISINRYNKHIQSLRINYPKTVKELQKINIVYHASSSNRLSQGLKIKDVSLLKRRKQSKQNIFQHKFEEINVKRSMGGLGIRSSSKKIDLYKL